MNSISSRRRFQMEERREQFQIMIQQESRHYHCADYFQVQQEPEPVCSPLQVVAQCAMLVTDLLPPTSPSPLPSPPSTNPSRVRSPVMTLTSLRSSSNDAAAIDDNGKSTRNICKENGCFGSQSISAAALADLKEWRHRMLQWAYLVLDTYNVDREVAAIAFHLLDRYMVLRILPDESDVESRPILVWEDFQLYAMVCLYIAIKSVVPVRKLTPGCLIEMSRGIYTERDVVQTELAILTALEWHINPATVMDFCRMYLALHPRSLEHEMILSSCRHQSELILHDPSLVSKPNSLIALATVLLITQRLEIDFQQTQGLLENLKGSVHVQPCEFDSLFQRLGGIC